MNFIFDLEKERFEWSMKNFPKQSSGESLKHLEKEIKEIRLSLNANAPDIIEFADAQMLLWDSVQRAGITLDELFLAFKDKFEENKLRKWNKSIDGHFEHIK